jgi:thioredoxin reductase
MHDKKIVILGDSPATYTCGIYLFTANLQPVIIKKNMGLDYICTFVPGLDVDKNEYNKKCHDQASNMGITIYNTEKIDISEVNGKFIVKYDENVIECDILVSDMPLSLKSNENLFVVENLLLEKEAIVVAGVGCMIAFEIKDMVH